MVWVKGDEVGVGERGWGGGEWVGGGRLYLLLGLFRVIIAVTPRSASYIGPDKAREPERCLTSTLTNTGVNFRPMPPI